MNSEPVPHIPARKRLGIVGMLLAFAVVGPFFTHGTESGNLGWGWFALFALNALLAAFTDVFF